MNLIDLICQQYEGNILLKAPLNKEKEDFISEELYSILCISNGIEECMIHPQNGEKIAISWIIYSYEMIVEESAFYKDEYDIEGAVFSDDGAGNPYIMKTNGTITSYNAIDNEENIIAASLYEFFDPKGEKNSKI